MFEDVVEEIFKEAGMSKKGNEELWKECSDILDDRMQFASAMYGLSKKRIELWELQKKTLVKELKEIKATPSSLLGGEG